MRTVLLERLKCNATEDFTGSDTCRLEIFVDGVLQRSLKKNLNDGEQWSINQSFTYKNKVEIKLWDEDSPDADDFLGIVAIDTSLKNSATASFTRDGANYQMWYKVVDAPDVDPVQEALKRFENSTKPGVWSKISKNELIGDIKRTIAQPYNVDQGPTELCGPGAIVFELVSKQPDRYIQICQDLYETGKFKGRTKEVKPSQTLLNSRIRNGISAADWMLMTTLRDVENALFSIDVNSGPVAMGITTPWEMKGWTFEILGYENVEFESTLVYGEFEAMEKARSVRNRGGVAFLLIHSAMLQGSTPTVAYPNHWVSFLGNLLIDDGVWYQHDSGNIKFDCYSWGKKCSINLGEGSFEDYMWGVVTGNR